MTRIVEIKEHRFVQMFEAGKDFCALDENGYFYKWMTRTDDNGKTFTGWFIALDNPRYEVIDD